MALCPQNIKSACGERFLFEEFDIGFDFFCFPLALEIGHVIRQIFFQQHLKVSAELNIRAAACHIGSNRNCARHTGFGDNRGFFFVVARIQDTVFNITGLEEFRQGFGFFNRDRADQHGLPFLRGLRNIINNRLELLALCPVEHILIINPLDGTICRNDQNFQSICIRKFGRLSLRCPCHARKLVI